MVITRALSLLLLLWSCNGPEGGCTSGAGDSTPPDSTPTPDDSGDPYGGTLALGSPPIVVVVLADDLGDNFYWAMPSVQAALEPDAVRFMRAYTTSPLCCPTRSSFMSGGNYPQLTGVLGNALPNGGVSRFHDTDTLATRLQAAGYTTALIGKYLNSYEALSAPSVPPGWDLFLVPTFLGDYTNTQLVRGSSTASAAGWGAFEDTGGEHLTAYLFEEALAFVDAHPDEPLFVLMTPESPHSEGTPALEDLGTWADYHPRPESFAEEDVSDKPQWVRDHPTPDEAEIAGWDTETQLMMENLASLDREVAHLLEGLSARGLDDRTFFVFTSDSGVLHGEHRAISKGLGYEESVRVPLLVRAPGILAGTDRRLTAINLDIPATVADIAGLPPLGEGTSLLAALEDRALPVRDHVYIETALLDRPVWTGVVTDRWKYVAWANGETELYDLDADPFELESLHAVPPEEAALAELQGWAVEHRSLMITNQVLMPAAPNVAYTEQLAAWGGVEPLTWIVDAGELPPGMALSPEGLVSGTSSEEGTWTVQIRVTDSERSAITGTNATFASSFMMIVGRPQAVSGSWSGDTAQFLVPARPGRTVHVEVTRDNSRDTAPRSSLPAVAGPDGWAVLTVDGLDPARTWSWHPVVEGVHLPGATLTARPGAKRSLR